MYDYMVASRYPHAGGTSAGEEVEAVYPVGSWLPYFRQLFGVALKIFSKLGFMALGGAGLIVVAMALTYGVCSYTPLCNISFLGQGVSPEAVRAMLSPEKITATAQFVQQAIDKYQQLQRAMN